MKKSMMKNDIGFCLAAFLLTLSGFFSSPLLAQCQMELTMPNVLIFWSTGAQSFSYPIGVERSVPSAPCRNYHITFSKGNSTTYQRYLQNSQASTLNYNCYSTPQLTSIVKEYPDATSSSEVLAGQFSGIQTQTTRTFSLNLPNTPQQNFLAAGLYQDTLVAKVYRGTFPTNNDPLDTANLSVQVFVAPFIRISLVDVGGTFDENDTSQVLNFGQLETGEQQSFDLIVQANTGHALSFASTNNGKLLHQNSNDHVPYQVKVNSLTKNLSQGVNVPVEVARHTGVTSQQGLAYRVEFGVGNADNKLAGQYHDFIVVTATSLE